MRYSVHRECAPDETRATFALAPSTTASAMVKSCLPVLEILIFSGNRFLVLFASYSFLLLRRTPRQRLFTFYFNVSVLIFLLSRGLIVQVNTKESGSSYRSFISFIHSRNNIK